MRNSSEEEIGRAVLRAYAEDPDKTMKIIFFARDVRGGLGERRFFPHCGKAPCIFRSRKRKKEHSPFCGIRKI